MSRIAGIVSAETRDGQLLEKMLIASRANSNWHSSAWVSEWCSLGWCGWSSPNIAIVEGIQVVMDGYIYNRHELGAGATDAHLISTLYREYGFEESLQKINGDFAIALYDARTETLWLARDRFGVKPLYYVSHSRRFAFASRLRALLVLPGVSSDVNPQFVALFAASHYRYFDNLPDRSPYADIAQLPAAHLLCLAKGELSVKKYWELEPRPDFVQSEAALQEQYRDLLLDAVSIRLKSASRPAFTLSGGMDSSSVLASAVHKTGVKQHAFSVVYIDKTYDESAEIHSMLDAAVSEWHPISISSPDIFALIQEMIEIHDEPVATATWLSHFLLMEAAARQGFSSSFGGLGGDELNAGEYEHFLYFFADLRALGLEQRLEEEVKMWIHYHDHPVFRKSRGFMEAELARLVDFNRPGRCLPDRKRLERYSAALNPAYFDLNSFDPVMNHPFDSYLKNCAYQDITRETIPCCLRAEDRQTTAFGLDNFLPFFDYRLVEFMFFVPVTIKYRDGVTKYLLRQAMRGILPEETRTRVKKTGWNAPAHQWFSGSGREQLLDLINSRAFRERGIYDISEVNRLIEEHQQIVSMGQVKDNHMMFLWQLVNLELWLQKSKT